MDRRSMLRWTGLAMMGFFSAPGRGRASCAATSYNALGPFHIPGAPFTKKLNVDDENGRPLTVSGRVFSLEDCKTIATVIRQVAAEVLS